MPCDIFCNITKKILILFDKEMNNIINKKISFKKSSLNCCVLSDCRLLGTQSCLKSGEAKILASVFSDQTLLLNYYFYFKGIYWYFRPKRIVIGVKI